MPHGRIQSNRFSNYRNKSRDSRSAAVAKARNTNTAVKTTRKKYKYAPKTFRNTKSITTLARQVRALQLQNHGDLQYQRQSCQFISNRNGTGSGPTTLSPIAFCLNSFYDKTPMYRGTLIGGVPSYAIAVDQFGDDIRWDKAGPQGTANLNPEYDWAKRNNADTVSRERYLPQSTKVHFRFTCPMWAQTSPIWWNIKVIRVHSRAVLNTNQQYSLPGQLGCYYGIAEQDLDEKRYLSKKYHTVLVDKWLKMSPRANSQSSYDTTVPTNGTAVMPVVTRDVFINYQFKGRKSLRPQLDDVTPAIPAGQEGDAFWVYTSEKDVLWCIISSSLNRWINPIAGGPPPAGNLPSTVQGHIVEMMRTNVWRDEDGSWGGP